MKLVQGYLDNRLTSEQLQELQTWINANKDNARVFARYCLLHSHIRENFRERDLQKSLDHSGLAYGSPMDTDSISTELILRPADSGQDRMDRIRQHAEHQLQAFLEEQEKRKKRQQLSRRPQRRFGPDWTKGGKKMADILSLGAKTTAGLAILSMLILTIMGAIDALRPKPTVVATIVDSIQARWSEPPIQPDLYPGWMILEEGYVRLQFKNGAEVIVEAPAKINVEAADQMFLDRGRLVVRAEDSAIGFTVCTPQSSVVDFGTEFGVLVMDGRGARSEVHVFKGHVELRCGSNPKKYKASRHLEANQACSVDKNGKLSSLWQARPSAFIRYVPCAYELAVLDSLPVAYWRFDSSTSGKLINVLEPVGFAGIAIDSARFTRGPDLGGEKQAQALLFDGKGSHILLPPTHVLANLGYMVVLWIRPDSIRAQTILERSRSANNSNPGGRRILAMTSEGQFYHTHLKDDGATFATALSQIKARSGQWYHVAFGREIGANKDRMLFINGSVEGIGKGEGTLTSGTRLDVDIPGICLGAAYESAKSDIADVTSFKGAIGQIAVYNRFLNAHEVQKLYEAGFTR